MSKPFYMDLKGFKEIQDRMLKAGERLKREVKEEIKDGAKVIVEKSSKKVRDNAFDQGQLARGIKSVSSGELQYDVLSTAGHSPFIEWGTKKRSKVPANLTSYAAQFKGLKAGSADEALFAITAWVKRKGIRFESAGKVRSGKRSGTHKKLTIEQTAYIIFHHIMIHGIRPRPFFFSTLDEQQPVIIKNIQTVLDDIL